MSQQRNTSKQRLVFRPEGSKYTSNTYFGAKCTYVGPTLGHFKLCGQDWSLGPRFFVVVGAAAGGHRNPGLSSALLSPIGFHDDGLRHTQTPKEDPNGRNPSF